MPASASAHGTGNPRKRARPPISGAAASTRAIQTDKTRNHLPDASPSRSAPAPSAAQASPQERRLPGRRNPAGRSWRGSAYATEPEGPRPCTRRRSRTGGAEATPAAPDHTAQAIPAVMRAKTGQTHQSKGISSSPLPSPAAMDAKPRTRQPCQHHAASRVHFPFVPFMRENRTGRAHP